MLGIYRFRNLKGDIIYIGKSTNLKIRWKQHFSREGHLPTKCYEEATSIEFSILQTKTDMDIYEIYLINRYNPKYNNNFRNNEKSIFITLPELFWEEYLPRADEYIGSNYKISPEEEITKPLTEEEFNKIISILQYGIKFIDKKGSKRRIEPNKQMVLILTIQANIGFKASEILEMKVKDIKNDTISFFSKKDKQIYERKTNIDFLITLKDYVEEAKLSSEDYIFNLTIRNIQLRLKKVVDFLGYANIGTHSFRKFYALKAYKDNNNNLEIVKRLLNHSNVAITQKYLNLNSEYINLKSFESNLK
ncbi:MAG: GIY-YIG nuclease family protein [Sarcina sp.]